MMRFAMGDLIKVSLTLGLLAIMFAQGLNLSGTDLGGFRRQPGTLARAFLAVDVLVPLGAIAVVAIFRPPLPIVVCLALMACSPMAAFGLRHVVASARLRPIWSGVYLALLLAALVTTPLTLVLLSRAFGFRASVSSMAIAGKVLGTVVLPVGVGMLVRRWRPQGAARLSATLQKAGAVLIVLPFLVVCAGTWRSHPSSCWPSRGDICWAAKIPRNVPCWQMNRRRGTQRSPS
jgi:BASS family bile acid:Na+ symporter